MRPRASGNNLICEELGAPGPGQLLRTLRTVSSLHCECTSRACGLAVWLCCFSGTSRNFFSQNSMVQWLLVNWHTTQHSSQSLIFILILTLTLLVSLPASGAIIRCLRAGCAFLRACTRAKTRASKGAQSVFCVIKPCTRAPLKLRPNN